MRGRGARNHRGPSRPGCCGAFLSLDHPRVGAPWLPPFSRRWLERDGPQATSISCAGHPRVPSQDRTDRSSTGEEIGKPGNISRGRLCKSKPLLPNAFSLKGDLGKSGPLSPIRSFRPLNLAQLHRICQKSSISFALQLSAGQSCCWRKLKSNKASGFFDKEIWRFADYPLLKCPTAFL